MIFISNKTFVFNDIVFPIEPTHVNEKIQLSDVRDLKIKV